MTYRPPEKIPTGVKVDDQKINAGGVSGLWGDQTDYNVFSADPMSDPNYVNNRTLVAQQLAAAFRQRPDELDVAGSNDWRNKQVDLAQNLQGVVNGTAGPSVAELQMGRGVDASNNAAASLAASSSNFGMDPAAAFRAALNQQAMNNQNLVGQTGQLRAQEVAQARGQLGQMYDSARSQDMSQAGAQLAAQMQSRQQQQQYINQLLEMGYTQDQANYMSQLQQQQFNVGSLAQQEAAKHGISTANSAQGIQAGSMLLKGAAMIAGGAAGGAAGAAKAGGG
jgi:hypothetical protein